MEPIISDPMVIDTPPTDPPPTPPKSPELRKKQSRKASILPNLYQSTVKRIPKVLYYVDESRDARAPDGSIKSRGYMTIEYKREDGVAFSASTRYHNFRSPWISVFRTEMAAKEEARRFNGRAKIIKVDGSMLKTVVTSAFDRTRDGRLLVLHEIPRKALMRNNKNNDRIKVEASIESTEEATIPADGEEDSWTDLSELDSDSFGDFELESRAGNDNILDTIENDSGQKASADGEIAEHEKLSIREIWSTKEGMSFGGEKTTTGFLVNLEPTWQRSKFVQDEHLKDYKNALERWCELDNTIEGQWLWANRKVSKILAEDEDYYLVRWKKRCLPPAWLHKIDLRIRKRNIKEFEGDRKPWYLFTEEEEEEDVLEESSEEDV